MTNSINYQMLFDKLATCGFKETTFQRNGSTRRAFTHPEIETAYIDLPDKPDTAAANMHKLAVRTILKRYDFLDENAWLRT